jgi:hypothetical protein
VNDPGAFAVDDLLVCGGRLRGIEADAENERASVSNGFGGIRRFLGELAAVS